MDEVQLIPRMIQAAEDWGQRQYGTKMTALSQIVLDHLDDGSITTTVELYRARPPSEASDKTEPVRCTVVIAPDGNITCREVPGRS